MTLVEVGTGSSPVEIVCIEDHRISSLRRNRRWNGCRVSSAKCESTYTASRRDLQGVIDGGARSSRRLTERHPEIGCGTNPGWYARGNTKVNGWA